jgi:hypothetical protein
MYTETPQHCLARTLAMDSPTVAGRHIIAHGVTASKTEYLESWAMDAWADAAYDIVQPTNAMGPDIEAALVVFVDGSCLSYRRAEPPRECALSDGLSGVGRLDTDAMASLLDSWSYPVRVAALLAVGELRKTSRDSSPIP